MGKQIKQRTVQMVPPVSVRVGDIIYMAQHKPEKYDQSERKEKSFPTRQNEIFQGKV
jgi:hypothetical protein